MEEERTAILMAIFAKLSKKTPIVALKFALLFIVGHLSKLRNNCYISINCNINYICQK